MIVRRRVANWFRAFCRRCGSEWFEPPMLPKSLRRCSRCHARSVTAAILARPRVEAPKRAKGRLPRSFRRTQRITQVARATVNEWAAQGAEQVVKGLAGLPGPIELVG